MTVSGSLAFTSGALYMVQVSGSNAGQIAVRGAASLAGNVEVDVLSRLTQKTTYTIFSSANPLSGTFNSVSLDNNFARDAVLTYVGDNVLLTLLPGLLSPVLPANAPANQVKVAGAIDNALLAGNNPTNAFNAIFNASGNPLLNGLTQLSGETATGSQQTTFNAMTQFMGILTDPFMTAAADCRAAAGRDAVMPRRDMPAPMRRAQMHADERDAYAMFTKAPLREDPRSALERVGGRLRRLAVDRRQCRAGIQQYDQPHVRHGGRRRLPFLAAHDRRVCAWPAAAPISASPMAAAGAPTCSRPALLSATPSGAAYISGALAYGWQDITTNRTVTIAGVDQSAARFNANAFSGRVEGGYRFVTPWIGGIGITPYAAAQFTTFDLPAYAEQVVIRREDLCAGLRLHERHRHPQRIRPPRRQIIRDANGILTLRGRSAWAHDYNPDRAIGATFQSLPGASFVVNGAAQPADSALTTASIEMKWMNGWSAAATFEGEFSNVTTSLRRQGRGALRVVVGGPPQYSALQPGGHRNRAPDFEIGVNGSAGVARACRTRGVNLVPFKRCSTQLGAGDIRTPLP